MPYEIAYLLTNLVDMIQNHPIAGGCIAFQVICFMCIHEVTK